MTLYLTNGFSDSMLRDPSSTVINYPLSKEQFINIIHNEDYTSVIGHDNIADYLSELTGKEIHKNRQGITLGYDDEVLVVSLMGRLPEHVRHVEFKGRLNINYKRFEKQSTDELLKSEARINEMIKIEEWDTMALKSKALGSSNFELKFKTRGTEDKKKVMI